MDIGKILGDIKGKVLDSKHFDMLKHAYDLQEQNLEQLRQNNAALRESNELLKVKLEQLSEENAQQNVRLVELKERVTELPKSVTENQLSDVAMDVLKVFHGQDAIALDEYDIYEFMTCSKIQTKAGLDELSDTEFIGFCSSSPRGIYYTLTTKARHMLALWG